MFQIKRDPQTGHVVGVQSAEGFHFKGDNSKWAEFIAWNAAQPEPLDVTDLKPEPLTPDQRRKQEYEKQGVTIEALTVALWEKMVEGRSAAADELQRKRDAIKEQFPVQTAQTVKG